MKFNIKNSMAGMLVAVSILPTFAFAEEVTTTAEPVTTSVIVSSTEKPITEVSGVFCTNIPKVSEKLITGINNTETKILKKWSDQKIKLTNKQGDADAKRATDRSNIDAKRVNNWEKMITKAKNPEQQAIITTYKTSIQTAVDARRTAVDSAVSAYRSGLTTITTTQSSAVEQALAIFKNTINDATIKSQNDCAAKVPSKTARATFNKSVNDARKVLQGVRNNSEIASGLKTLKQTRDTAIKAAEVAFKISTDQARALLTASLKK